MSSADRLVVPLNSMCSMKCEMPFCPVDSRREPEPIQIPTDTLRTCGMTSVITRTPLPSVLISMFRKGSVLVGDVIREEGKGAYFSCRDRKSTRLNSSHLGISYAVFCLKKKKKIKF